MNININKETQGAKNNDILRMNSALILRLVRERNICSRVELAKATGLTQASITKIVASLIQQDILIEVGNIKKSDRGRKSIGLRLNGDCGKVIALKLSRTFITIAVFDISGKQYTQTTFDIPKTKTLKESFLNSTAIIGEYMTAYDNIVAIGVAVPGPYLKNSGLIATKTDTHNWTTFRPKELLESKFHLPVFMVHDANAAALAHWWFANSSSNTHVLGYMLLGEGIGGGLVVDGQLYEGATGTSLEIAHISIDVNGKKCTCGNRGCLEQYCSSTALIKRAKEASQLHPEGGLSQYRELTYYDIFNEFEKKDELAISLIKETCQYIGYGVVNFIYAYNPNIIILGGQMTRAGNLLLNTVIEIVKDRVYPEIYEKTEIRLSNIQNDPILYGAAAIATDYVLSYSLDVFQK